MCAIPGPHATTFGAQVGEKVIQSGSVTFLYFAYTTDMANEKFVRSSEYLPIVNDIWCHQETKFWLLVECMNKLARRAATAFTI
jgi:hypothetical protein